MFIFKYIFLILIITGCTSIGFLLSKAYIDRVKELKSISKLINLLKNKIKFTYMPLSEAFKQIAILSDNRKISKIFISTSEKLENKTFNLAWKEAIDEEKVFLNLKKDDINLINTFGAMLGKTDMEGQINEIESFNLLLESRIKKAEEESLKNGKMYKSLGTIIGLAIVIILF